MAGRHPRLESPKRDRTEQTSGSPRGRSPMSEGRQSIEQSKNSSPTRTDKERVADIQHQLSRRLSQLSTESGPSSSEINPSESQIDRRKEEENDKQLKALKDKFHEHSEEITRLRTQISELYSGIRNILDKYRQGMTLEQEQQDKIREIHDTMSIEKQFDEKGLGGLGDKDAFNSVADAPLDSNMWRGLTSKQRNESLQDYVVVAESKRDALVSHEKTVQSIHRRAKDADGKLAQIKEQQDRIGAVEQSIRQLNQPTPLEALSQPLEALNRLNKDLPTALSNSLDPMAGEIPEPNLDSQLTKYRFQRCTADNLKLVAERVVLHDQIRYGLVDLLQSRRINVLEAVIHGNTLVHKRELKTVLEAKGASTSNRGNGSKFVQESTDLMGLQTSLSRTAIQKALEIW